MPSPTSPGGTTACGAAAGAPTSTAAPTIPNAPRSATGRTSSGSSNRAAPTLRWCSTATSRSPWCQFGTVEELPNIHHRKEWEQGLVRRPDFRITCLFVDRRYRRKGVAATAVVGALELIGIAGGGLVEAYPHDLPPGKKTSASFLYNATRTMYEQLGFTYQRPKGQGNCVMTKQVPANPDKIVGCRPGC